MAVWLVMLIICVSVMWVVLVADLLWVTGSCWFLLFNIGSGFFIWLRGLFGLHRGICVCVVWVWG